MTVRGSDYVCTWYRGIFTDWHWHWHWVIITPFSFTGWEVDTRPKPSSGCLLGLTPSSNKVSSTHLAHQMQQRTNAHTGSRVVVGSGERNLVQVASPRTVHTADENPGRAPPSGSLVGFAMPFQPIVWHKVVQSARSLRCPDLQRLENAMHKHDGADERARPSSTKGHPGFVYLCFWLYEQMLFHRAARYSLPPLEKSVCSVDVARPAGRTPVLGSSRSRVTGFHRIRHAAGCRP